MSKGLFSKRHIGPDFEEIIGMLASVGTDSVDELIDQTVPSSIRLNSKLNLNKGLTEEEYSNHINELGDKNKRFKNYIGLGYHPCVIPAVIRRNILENPGWYTAYTPYQAEISQGRLEMLLNFQTVISDFTGMPIANASLLDEGTAAAEAMIMLYNSRSRAMVKEEVSKFFVSKDCYPQTISILKTRAVPLGIDLVIGNEKDFDASGYFGVLVQYPNVTGEINDYSTLVQKAHENQCGVVVATDLLSLSLLEAPGSWGADVVVGSSQRFGIPLGFGGPHAAFFATKEEFKRQIPGRIIGVSEDRNGKPALRMALQTREQHIRRDKATSNICTAQALLAIMAAGYAIYHGKDGINEIAMRVHYHTKKLYSGLRNTGIEVLNTSFFDTICLKGLNVDDVKSKSEKIGVNFGYFDDSVAISLNELTTKEDVDNILSLFGEVADVDTNYDAIPSNLVRKTDFLTNEVFSKYRSETSMMRYLKSLENKDISLTHSMISLGSCTMKLNAASELYPISNPNFSDIHPFAPADQSLGYQEMIDELERDLCSITGFKAISFQPNSGAQGEYAGLLAIRNYHMANGDENRNIALIPSSAHGTNPASAVMAGMKVVVVKCDDQGNIDISDLRTKAEKHKEDLSSLMVTYPSTHGVYEEGIIEITNIIHENGGLVYMDGANMNAQVGLTNPASIGADVCHLNLHKTFAIPHGGGGPGMGPIGVVEKLVPYLPGHVLTGENSNEAVSSAEYGSALILLISYGYIKMLGLEGLENSTKIAILNANYLKSKLEDNFDVLYVGNNGKVAHEMIVDCREFKKTAGIEVEDIAKRLIDYGFHAPTVSFPVAGTLMIEPTESENKEELDRFAEAMNAIREEIRQVELGIFDKENNVLKNAPHTASMAVDEDWSYPYTRQEAVYPLNWVRDSKYWVPVARINNVLGDRNLICTCPDISEYENIEA